MEAVEAILAGDICKEAGQQGWRLKCVWTYLIQDCLNGQETQSAPSAIKSVSRTTNHVSASLSGELSARVFLLRTYTEGRISPLISPPRPISCRCFMIISCAKLYVTACGFPYWVYCKSRPVVACERCA